MMTRAATALTSAGAVVAGLWVVGDQPGAGETPVGRSGDAERGRQVFQKCYACHSVVAGERGLTGPNLAGVVGRRRAQPTTVGIAISMRCR